MLKYVGVLMRASIPPVLLNLVQRFRALHRIVLLTTVTTEEIPHVVGDRASVEPLGGGLYGVLLRSAFIDEPHVHEALATVVHGIEPGADATALKINGPKRSGSPYRILSLSRGISDYIQRHAHS